MTEIVTRIYVADDGEKFYTEMNCMIHEIEYLRDQSGIQFLDSDYCPMWQFTPGINAYDDAKFITIDRTKDEANKKFIEKAYEYFGWVLLKDLLKEPFFNEYYMHTNRLEGVR